MYLDALGITLDVFLMQSEGVDDVARAENEVSDKAQMPAFSGDGGVDNSDVVLFPAAWRPAMTCLLATNAGIPSRFIRSQQSTVDNPRACKERTKHARSVKICRATVLLLLCPPTTARGSAKGIAVHQ